MTHVLLGFEKPHPDARKTWCGVEYPFEASYLDAGHLSVTIKAGSSWGDPCPKCVRALIKVLEPFTERES